MYTYITDISFFMLALEWFHGHLGLQNQEEFSEKYFSPPRAIIVFRTFSLFSSIVGMPDWYRTWISQGFASRVERPEANQSRLWGVEATEDKMKKNLYFPLFYSPLVLLLHQSTCIPSNLFVGFISSLSERLSLLYQLIEKIWEK